jgi:hypothetical protein
LVSRNGNLSKYLVTIPISTQLFDEELNNKATITIQQHIVGKSQYTVMTGLGSSFVGEVGLIVGPLHSKR